MFHILILLISLCEIYPVPAPDDFLLKEFSTPQPFEDIGFGCTESSFSGNLDNLTIQLKHESDAPPGESLSPQEIFLSGSPEKISISPLPPGNVPVAPPRPPDDERYFLTPEPAVIIVLTGLLLLFLLFARKSWHH